MPNNASQRRAIEAFSVALLLLACALLYAPALGGTFLLDDAHNLGPLATVRDAGSALQFVLTGPAGPLGRPLSLLTFVPQADQWGGPARPFILVNIVIHLLNGLLAYGLFRALARARFGASAPGHWPALAAAALWLLLPILASSTLMVVQRMATLAATGVLLGLLGYLYFRRRLVSGERWALAGMAASVLIGAAVAALFKENGALLPLFVLVVESTLLDRPDAVEAGSWRRWQLAVLGVPTVAVLGYLLSCLHYDAVTVLERDFNAFERLMTEARILWEYVVNSIVPRPAAFGPFHDDARIARSLLDPLTLVAVAGWIGVTVAAVLYRRRWPLAAFAVLWFVTGHLLESTTVPLYLYFEHRNYIPLLGPAFAIACGVFSIDGPYRLAARAMLGFAIAINAGVLFGVTSLWGEPRAATESWYRAAPRSAAAASHLAQQQFARDGVAAGIETLREFVAREPQHGYLRFVEITTLCRVAADHDQRETVELLRESLASASFTPGLGPMFDELIDAGVLGSCNGVDAAALRRLLDAALENPRFASNPDYMGYHHQLLAKLAFTDGDFDTAVRELRTARSFATHRDLNLMLVSTLARQSKFDEARAVIDDARGDLPFDPRERIATGMMLDELERYVDAVEDGS